MEGQTSAGNGVAEGREERVRGWVNPPGHETMTGQQFVLGP